MDYLEATIGLKDPIKGKIITLDSTAGSVN